MSQPLHIKAGDKAFFIGATEEAASAKITYKSKADKVIIVDHTFVSESLRGKGVALQLVRHIIDFARKNQIKIIPECPYASKVLSDHELYHDVLYSEE